VIASGGTSPNRLPKWRANTGLDTLDLTRSLSRAYGEKAASMRPIVAASAIGTTIEWYDFLIYAAALVLNKLFSPPKTP